MNTATSSGVVYEDKLPWIVRILGGRWRESPTKSEFRMKWGELNFCSGLALELCLFEKGFTFHIHALWTDIYLRLPALRRFRWDPLCMMESWGASLVDGSWHFHWGPHTKILTLPWHDWRQTADDVLRPDGSWVPYVGSWERNKEPDGRHTETHPYRYVLNSGEVQHRTAEVYVERRTRKLRCLSWLPFGVTTHAIDVKFSDEVGEGTGSWKGGTIGCGYTLRPNETPRECLKRMERERKFSR